jgi:hydroxypyruvate reductase/glycerate 2-kinase
VNPIAAAEKIFKAGVKSVLPDRMIRNHLKIRGDELIAGNIRIALNDVNNIYVIGAGKAGALMARETEIILAGRITGGHVIVKYDSACRLNNIRITEAGHPIPDSNGFEATREILAIASGASENDLVICLLSGGGSALLADFPEGSSPEEMIMVNDLLIRSGADIRQINAVRKHLSKIKGGHLARTVYPATLISLILSDVIGDPLDVIASGPTVPDTSTFDDALKVIDNFHLTELMPKNIIRFLKDGSRGIHPETPKYGDPVFEKTYNFLTGSNRIALEASAAEASEMGFFPVVLDSRLCGDTGKVSEMLIDTAVRYQNDKMVQKPVCLLFGGETTIKVSGNGLGGRNQHLALHAALLLKDKPGITLLAAGTDGTDGPTDAAGAVVSSATVPSAASLDIDPGKYLAEFNSYNFFKNTGGHIITGPTMTNVMDLIVIIIE